AADVVSDAAHGGGVLTGGVVELPVLIALAGEDRAGVAASHRDHDVGLPHGIGGESARCVCGDVDSLLGHHPDCDGVDALFGLRPGGEHVDAPSGEGGEVPGSHLGAPGIVDADEQDGGLVAHGVSVPFRVECSMTPRYTARRETGEAAVHPITVSVSSTATRRTSRILPPS